MDTLVELPVEQWPVLKEKLRKLWPLNLPGYYTLHVNLKYPQLREAFHFKVFCPDGYMDNGFVGFHSINGIQAYMMFSITEDTSKLEEALMKTKLIDWNKRVVFNLVSSLTIKSYDQLALQLNLDKYGHMYHMFCLDRNSEPFLDLRPPDNKYLASVKQEDTKHVAVIWPYSNAGSHHYFSTLATNGLSYGLYSFDTHELLAWLFINNNGFLSHLFCEQKCRSKGYEEYVMKCATNDLLKDGNDVYAYVKHGNDKPMSIFRSMGFKNVDEVAFIQFRKKRLNYKSKM